MGEMTGAAVGGGVDADARPQTDEQKDQDFTRVDRSARLKGRGLPHQP